jgi:predicted ABC-type ATPase
MKQNFYIIAGCNGAGKTTASFTILPEILDCKEFVNADEIAKGLSPFQPEKVAIEAGRIMLHRIDELLKKRQDFAIETTLATKIYKNKIIEAQKDGYNVVLLYFWLRTVELAIDRVEMRVLEGGHHIETDVIRRRYTNGIKNLFEIYLDIADKVIIVDNSDKVFETIAEKSQKIELVIYNFTKFEEIKSKANGK